MPDNSDLSASATGTIPNESHIRQDVERLAGALPHRGSNTQQERAAAEYLLERFHEYTADVEMDDFYSSDNPAVLFASYYAEFVVVAVLSHWFPWVALIYGLGVFLAYVMEFTGYCVMSRFMPQYETQNVVARFLGTKPRKLIVVSANYDAGKTSPLTESNVLPRVRLGHLILVLAMVLVVVTCGLNAFGRGETDLYAAMSIARNAALGILLVGASLLFFGDLAGEHVRGAVNNAAGVAGLLALAQRLCESPVENADVWLVATGSKESWMDGMRHFVASHKPDRGTTYFLNVASAGAGQLRYVTAEGMLHLFRAAPELKAAAQRAAKAFGATALRYRSLPTDAIIPLARGYKTLGIMSTNEQGLPPYWRSHEDTTTRVNYDQTSQTASFVEAIVREIGARS